MIVIVQIGFLTMVLSTITKRATYILQKNNFVIYHIPEKAYMARKKQSCYRQYMDVCLFLKINILQLFNGGCDMITLFLLSLFIKLTGLMLIYSFRLAWEIVTFIICFVWFFLIGFIQAAASEYKRIKTAFFRSSFFAPFLHDHVTGLIKPACHKSI